MIYTLTTPTGREYAFYTLSLAEIYRSVYGGEILVLGVPEEIAA